MDLPAPREPGEPASDAPEPASPPPAVAPDSGQTGTILSLQVLRFVAALGVAIFHAYFALGIQSGRGAGPSEAAFDVGRSGVHVFFVISGFVMVYTSFRSRLTPGKFLLRRLIRIYPIYWVVAAIYVVAHLFIGSPYSLTAAQAIGAVALFPGLSAEIIGPGWTLSFEMYFYLCFAIALFAGLRRGIVFLSLIYLASLAMRPLVGAEASTESPLTFLITDPLLLEFVAGAWLGYAFAHGRVAGRFTGGVLIFLSLAVFAAGAPFVKRLPEVILWGPPSLMLVTGALAFEPQLRSPAGRAFAKLGDSSYLLYLSHVLLLDLLLTTPVRLLNVSETAAIVLAIPLALVCTLIAAAGYEVIELPLLKLMKRLFLRRPPRPLQTAAR